jgi:hypothetical protein
MPKPPKSRASDTDRRLARELLEKKPANIPVGMDVDSGLAENPELTEAAAKLKKQILIAKIPDDAKPN